MPGSNDHDHASELRDRVRTAQVRVTVIDKLARKQYEVEPQEVTFHAPAVPGLTKLRVIVMQREVTTSAETLVTITDSLEAAIGPAVVNTRGLPGYTFERAVGELWRSGFDAAQSHHCA